jgi:hypothetical protein
VDNTVTVNLSPPSGDFNGDGNVNGRDFLAWQRGFGKSNATAADGDADGDGDVDGDDLTLWSKQFGSTTTSLALGQAEQLAVAVEEDAFESGSPESHDASLVAANFWLALPLWNASQELATEHAPSRHSFVAVPDSREPAAPVRRVSFSRPDTLSPSTRSSGVVKTSAIDEALAEWDRVDDVSWILE